MSLRKTYKRHYVKIDPRTRKYAVNQDGTPVIGDFDRECRLTEDDVRLLAGDGAWQSSGLYYVEVGAETSKNETKKEDQEEEKKPESNEESELEELREKAKELGVKSYHVMKEDKLKEKIKEKSK